MKCWNSLPFVLLLLVAAGAATLRAAEAPQSLPDDAIKAYLEAIHMKPIVVPEKPRLSRDFEEQWFKWAQRAIIDPFAKRLKLDEAAKTAAVRTVSEGLRLMHGSSGKDVSLAAKVILDQCESLQKTGTDDVLVETLRGWALFAGQGDNPGSDKIFAELLRTSRYRRAPAVVRWLAIDTLRRVLRDGQFSEHALKYDKDFAEVALKSVRDKAYLPEDEEVLAENLQGIFGEYIVESQEKNLQALCEEKTLSEWERLMCTGFMENTRAWLARGHQWASGTKPESLKSFPEHMAAARGAFEKAWQMHPDRPQAAARVLRIIVVSERSHDEDARLWFDRALAAQFDYMDAYSNLLFGCYPRWGGSAPKMLGVGLACALTHRYETRVPNFFFQALGEVLYESEESRPLCQNPIVSAVALALTKQRLQDADNAKTRQTAQQMVGIYAWISGDYATAASAFEKAPERFTQEARRATIPFFDNVEHPDEQIIRGESILFAKGLRNPWLQAEDALKAGARDQAVTAYEAMLPHVSGAGADLVKGRLATVNFERELRKGGWVRLQAMPGLYTWQIEKGDWSGTADGVLVNHGLGESAYIVYSGRVGTEFQIRGEAEMAPADGAANFGFMLGHGYEGKRENWIGLDQYQGSKGTEFRILNNKTLCTVRNRWSGQDPTRAKFLLTCRKGRISYVVNDLPVFTDIMPYNTTAMLDWPLHFTQDGRIGFGSYMVNMGNECRLLKAEVRVLSPDEELPLPPAPPPRPASAKAITTPEQLLAYLEGTVWNVGTTPDGSELGSVEFRSAWRNFEITKRKDGNHKRHTMSAIDAHSIDLDHGEHILKFNDDFSRFEIPRWPDKNKDVLPAYGTVKSRPGPTVTEPGKPFEFAGTKWRRLDSVIEFRADGSWHDSDAKKPIDGQWRLQSFNQAAVILNDKSAHGRDDSTVRNFTVSSDGRLLTRDDEHQWERNP